MEIILVLGGILVLAAFSFLLIEFPYYLMSVFVFLHLYNFNIEIPGPLDLRGLLSVFLLLRLVIFDKRNLNLIRESLSNKFFFLIILFTLYVALVDYFNGYSYFKIFRLILLNLTALLLGFITILKDYGKQTIFLTILITGIAATGDLIYSYFVEGSLMIKRIIDVVLSGGTAWETMNHNFFGQLCGFAVIIAFLLLITKNINKIVGLILLIVFSLGMIISTSRGAFIAVVLTLVLILFTQHGLYINFKKVFVAILLSLMILVTVAFSYSYILSAMNIKTEFSEQIHWRLVEEPLSFFNDDTQEFGWDNNKVQGTMRWRYNKYLRDADVFFKQNFETILFGFGTGGYKYIGLIQYQGTDAYQYSAHNFYTNMVAEYGIVGLILFLLFLFSLIYSALKRIKKGWIQISLVYLLCSLFIGTFFGDPHLTDDFSFILFGCVFAEIQLAKFVQNHKIETQN